MAGSFAPQVRLPDGTTYAPKGWEWVLAFAMRGVPWAVQEALRPSFRRRALADYAGQDSNQKVIEAKLSQIMLIAERQGIKFVPDQWDRILEDAEFDPPSEGS